MKNFYFDLCAIPLFLLIIYVYYSRRITRYREYRMFFTVTAVSLVCAVLDIAMEFVVNPLPLSPANAALGMGISTTYKVLRNSCMVLYLMFVVNVTRTSFQMKSTGFKALLWAPYAILCVLLLQNLFTGNVFSVTVDEGYIRGPMLYAVYAIAGTYDIIGIVYCLYCRRYLEREKWAALLSVYILISIAIVVQFFYADLLLEMFSTALGLLMVMLTVLRPEDSIDSSVGVQNWKSFQTELKNILRSRQHVELIVFQILNARENRYQLGDSRFTQFIADSLDAIHEYADNLKVECQMYYEQPETIYILSDGFGSDPEEFIEGCLAAAQKRLRDLNRSSIWFNAQICFIKIPDDLPDEKDIVNLCHRFPTLVDRTQTVSRASELINTRDFMVLNHIEEILERAITEHGLEMHYQPIYDIKQKKFISAEALARIDDKEFGMIPPGIFIPSAEKSGVILLLGDAIIEAVFKFIAEHNMDELGLSYIEINLSIEQCLEPDLADTIVSLQKKYGIAPKHVNFEITETGVGSVSNVMRKNLKRLFELGYRFSLDDYGTGYSNIQRLQKLPLSIIKIDKSLVDEMFTAHGSVIMQNTISMMQGIDKKLVMEGVETKEALDVLEGMSCDYIQGYYFSKPLPTEEFIEFMKTHRSPA